MNLKTRWVSLSRTGRLRLVVLLIASATTAFKVFIASNTLGTNDVNYWTEFAAGVKEFGPINIYGNIVSAAQYNHPPLSGWLLYVINWATAHHLASLPLLIRLPSSFADVVTALVVFELIQMRHSAGRAAVSGVLVALSPVMMIISGFHGNTDPVWVMFALLSIYLTASKRLSVVAGVSIALAMSLKLVPVILVPILLLAILRNGRRYVIGFLAGSGTAMSLLWLPVVMTRWTAFKDNVLSYAGIDSREWGLVQFSRWAGLPEGFTDFLIGPGRFVILVLSALLPLLLLWRRPKDLAAASGLSLSIFLLFSPAFSMQYLAWPLAATYFIGPLTATCYNLTSAVLAVVVYNNWNSAYPWDWYEGHGTPFRPQEFVLAVIAWIALATVVGQGLCLLRRPKPDDTGEASDQAQSAPQLTVSSEPQ